MESLPGCRSRSTAHFSFWIECWIDVLEFTYDTAQQPNLSAAFRGHFLVAPDCRSLVSLTA